MPSETETAYNDLDGNFTPVRTSVSIKELGGEVGDEVELKIKVNSDTDISVSEAELRIDYNLGKFVCCRLDGRVHQRPESSQLSVQRRQFEYFTHPTGGQYCCPPILSYQFGMNSAV